MVIVDYNDIFNKFSEAMLAKFGKLPEDMTKAEYDAAMTSITKTDFYKNLPQQPVGFTFLRWALTYRDKEVCFLLINEVKSPTWHNSEKINYLDAACDAMGLPHLDFSICKTLDDIKGHAYRGPLVSRSASRRALWDTQQGPITHGYKSVNMDDDLFVTIAGLQASFASHI